MWDQRRPADKNHADINKRLGRKPNGFGQHFWSSDRLCGTIVSGDSYFMTSSKSYVSDMDLCKVGSYPLDYKFPKCGVQYLVGMSVPPVMMAQVANQVRLQWFANAVPCILSETVKRQKNGREGKRESRSP